MTNKVVELKDHLDELVQQYDRKLMLEFKLTPVSYEFLRLLLVTPIVTPEMIFSVLGFSTKPRIAAYRLRLLLEPFDIKVQSRRHVGYWLSDEDKLRVNDRMKNPLVTTEVTKPIEGGINV